MTFAAIMYKVQPGHEEEIAEIFSPANFKRVGTAQVQDQQGEQSGRILGTGLFIQDDTMVRVIQHEGSLADLGAHMGSQRGVHEAERRLAPFLAAQRDTETSEGFQAHFRNSIMQCVQQRAIEERPGAQLAALRYRIKPGSADAIAKIFADVQGEARPALRDQQGQEIGVILAVALFIKDDAMIRVVQYDGELEDVANYMANRGGRPDLEQRLAPYMAEERHVETKEAFLHQFHANTMRRISMLSVATLAAGR
ncbi:MAG: hypothetical protein AUI10_07190 [Actinobacteria bacterium 13_2_20CM_2_72_6]|jgi:SchA/CurD like domain-containing protein|nr:MAG: hypothetical protein AUI10_07190 [Actinobacteria bacterium 13_2_20CM_2_72_6]